MAQPKDDTRVTVGVTMTREEKAELVAAAQKSGTWLATFLRVMALKAARS